MSYITQLPPVLAPFPEPNYGVGASLAGLGEADAYMKTYLAVAVPGGLAALTALMFLPKKIRGAKRKQYAIGAGLAVALLAWKLKA